MAALKTASKKGTEMAKIAQEIDNPIFSTYLTTSNNYHRGYDFNQRRNSQSATRWDCSELSAAVQRQFIKDLKEVDKESNEISWKTNFDKLEKAFPAGSTTVSQRAKLEELGVPKITGKKNVMDNLKPGMLIYMTHRSIGGYSGHVATVTRDPESGDLMISESIGGKKNIGVIHRSVDDFFKKGRAINDPKLSISLYDPYHKDRDTLDKMDKEAVQFKSLYKEAEKAYKAQSGLQKVGLNNRIQNRFDFIADYIEDKLDEKSNNNLAIQTHRVAGITKPQLLSQNNQNPTINNKVEHPLLNQSYLLSQATQLQQDKKSIQLFTPIQVEDDDLKNDKRIGLKMA